MDVRFTDWQLPYSLSPAFTHWYGFPRQPVLKKSSFIQGRIEQLVPSGSPPVALLRLSGSRQGPVGFDRS